MVGWKATARCMNTGSTEEFLMKTLLLASMFAILASSLWYVENPAYAQQGKNVASVTEVVGVCHVRDGAEAKPRGIKVNDNLRADQEVLCNAGGRITLRFESTSETREITPRWLKVGNASVAPPSEPSSGNMYKPEIGGRKASIKSDDPVFGGRSEAKAAAKEGPKAVGGK
jgi:hypothetical protein